MWTIQTTSSAQQRAAERRGAVAFTEAFGAALCSETPHCQNTKPRAAQCQGGIFVALWIFGAKARVFRRAISEPAEITAPAASDDEGNKGWKGNHLGDNWVCCEYILNKT